MSKLELDFDIFDPRITLSGTISKDCIADFEIDTRIRLPESFKECLSEVSDEIVINIGNLIHVIPLVEGEQSTKSLLQRPNPYGWNLPDGIIPFAFDGCGELWGFYYDPRLDLDELPVVWMTPGDLKGKGYVFCNTSFQAFINIRALLLFQTDTEEGYKTLEEAEAASPPELLEESDREYQALQDPLYAKYDPKFRVLNHDLFQEATSIDQVILQIREFYK